MSGLLLTRRLDQSFECWGPCKVTVTKLQGDSQVQLRIEADDDVPIWRSELITKEMRNESASDI